jgi:hypothetical protein
MYLTITTTHTPATDLGYLLHKRPGKLHTIALSFGQAHVFYPEASDTRCTAALMLEVDPIELVAPTDLTALQPSPNHDLTLLNLLRLPLHRPRPHALPSLRPQNHPHPQLPPQLKYYAPPVSSIHASEWDQPCNL